MAQGIRPAARVAESVSFELLQKPVSVIDILVYLYRHGKSAPVDILGETGMNHNTFYAAKERLMSLGFLYEDRLSGWPRYHYVGLTRAGEEVARALAPAGDLLSATVTALEGFLKAETSLCTNSFHGWPEAA